MLFGRQEKDREYERGCQESLNEETLTNVHPSTQRSVDGAGAAERCKYCNQSCPSNAAQNLGHTQEDGAKRGQTTNEEESQGNSGVELSQMALCECECWPVSNALDAN